MSDIKIASIINSHKEIISALKNSGDYHWLISKCSSQSRLAGIERKSAGIVFMTLNTFKKYADEYIDGGFNEINRLRKELKNRTAKGKKIKSQKQKESLSSYKKKLDDAERMRAILIRAYNDLNEICMDAISRSPQYQYDYNRHKSLYRKHFGISIAVDNE